MLEVQRPAMATHSTYDMGDSPRRFRAASIDSYNSNLSLDSYTSAYSSTSGASSTFVHPRSIYSVSDTHTETEESANSIEVQHPESPIDYAHEGDQDIVGVHVLCLYDFDSDDPDHTPFKKNDILKVIKQEPSGWWAAQSGDRVGWIPSAFVMIIPPYMVQKLMDAPYDLREYEYEAEALYSGALMASLRLDGEGTPPKEQIYFENDDVR